MKAASRRAVLKTARIATAELKVATRSIMGDEPGGYDPYKAANFRVPRVRTRGGVISAGTGYTREGYIDRFRSTGTKPNQAATTSTEAFLTWQTRSFRISKVLSDGQTVTVPKQ
jgi:hypothetical protein